MPIELIAFLSFIVVEAISLAVALWAIRKSEIEP